jgi:BirA family biotin operon repressor/biotin-[acetyl-CoA-carboxylase] ligase
MQLRLILHGVVDSTNERAFAALASGAARDGDVHVARGQTHGRGRLGRRWHSPDGEGLYLSMIVMPAPPPPPAPALTMAAGLALLDAARELDVPDARLKWPNDLVAGGRKLAGVLVETRGADPARPRFVVGVGFNVLQRGFPADVDQPATSLAQLGLDATVDEARDAVVAALIARLGALGDSGALERDYRKASGLERGRVRAQIGTEELFGELVELTIAGGLRLATAGSERRAPLELVRALAPA